jgi:D-amino peptidase
MYRPALFVLAMGICAAQGPKIFIVTDMEGVGGVNNADEQLLPGQRRYEESRHLLAGEVNAAVAGALEAGASLVVIWDGHDSSRSLSVDDIHPRAQLIQGSDTPPDYYLGEKLYDGIMFVGQHAMAGARGVLSHSQSFSVQNIFLNGQPVGEIGQVAAIAGQFDIPIIMLSGDQAACDEVLTLQPKAETVAVKRLMGKSSTLSLSHAEARLQIQAAANRAVKRISEFKPWKLQTPVEMKIEFYPGAAGVPATALNRGENKQVAPRTVVYRGRTVLEVYQHWLAR